MRLYLECFFATPPLPPKKHIEKIFLLFALFSTLIIFFDLSFKIEDQLSKNDSTNDYMKFLDQLENQRTNIDIQGNGESDEVIKG